MPCALLEPRDTAVKESQFLPYPQEGFNLVGYYGHFFGNYKISGI